MRLGICTDIERINDAKKAGFDYIEVNASMIAALPQDEFEKKLNIVRSSEIKCECFNILFSSAITLLGNNASSWNDVETHLRNAFKRISILGGSIVVFGSGKCRSFPQGMNFFEAQRKLTDIISKVGKIADEYGICIVVEPLNHKETNMICTVAEGAVLVSQINTENVRLLADGYHMFTNGEPLSDIARIADFEHIHIATKDGRLCPTEKDDLLEEFFKQLCAIGYDGRVSIEGAIADFETDTPKACALLRQLSTM